MMLLQTVQSTTLITVGYDLVAQLLRLQFPNRAVYDYTGVPADVYQGLLSAPSKGEYFNRVIRGRFPFRKITGPAS